LYRLAVTRILLVRHGQSEWNAAGRWQGRADPPLTAAGRRQAVEATEAIGIVDAIAASPLERAFTTAAIVAELTGVGPVEVHDGLVERDCGEWTGLTAAEIEHHFPGALAEWRTPPGWEDDDQLIGRVELALVALATAYPGGQVLAVTHGGVMFALERHLQGRNGGRIPNLGGCWLEVGIDGGLRLGARVPLLPEHDGVAAEEQV
jgi:broad specificity phosphatase PhoE